MASDAGWRETAIDGVTVRSAAVLPDERGAFMELWRGSWMPAAVREPLVQCNLSRSSEGVLRGMHFHQRQADLWMVVAGRALAATTDLRPRLADPDRPVPSQVIELAAGDALYVPRLVAHGFLAITEVLLVYLVSNEYDGSDELGFRWDDPDAAIAWPSAQPIVSDRDRQSPSLREAVAALRQPGQDAER